MFVSVSLFPAAVTSFTVQMNHTEVIIILLIYHGRGRELEAVHLHNSNYSPINKVLNFHP